MVQSGAICRMKERHCGLFCSKATSVATLSVCFVTPDRHSIAVGQGHVSVGVMGKMRNVELRNSEGKMRNQKLWKRMRNGGYNAECGNSKPADVTVQQDFTFTVLYAELTMSMLILATSFGQLFKKSQFDNNARSNLHQNLFEPSKTRVHSCRPRAQTQTNFCENYSRLLLLCDINHITYLVLPHFA